MKSNAPLKPAANASAGHALRGNRSPLATQRTRTGHLTRPERQPHRNARLPTRADPQGRRSAVTNRAGGNRTGRASSAWRRASGLPSRRSPSAKKHLNKCPGRGAVPGRNRPCNSTGTRPNRRRWSPGRAPPRRRRGGRAGYRRHRRSRGRGRRGGRGADARPVNPWFPIPSPALFPPCRELRRACGEAGPALLREDGFDDVHPMAEAAAGQAR
jgi:hypothetical protein